MPEPTVKKCLETILCDINDAINLNYTNSDDEEEMKSTLLNAKFNCEAAIKIIDSAVNNLRVEVADLLRQSGLKSNNELKIEVADISGQSGMNTGKEYKPNDS